MPVVWTCSSRKTRRNYIVSSKTTGVVSLRSSAIARPSHSPRFAQSQTKATSNPDNARLAKIRNHFHTTCPAIGCCVHSGSFSTQRGGSIQPENRSMAAERSATGSCRT